MTSEIFLVTGGAGFIGSHLTEKLLGMGHRVRVLDNLNQGMRDRVPGEVEFIEGDITDLETCKHAAKGVAGIFHMAAMSKVGPSIEKIEYCTEQNVLGTQNVLIAAREAKVRKLVYSASSSYYGNQSSPQTEDMLPDCLNPYSLSKYVGELYCKLFNDLYDVPTVALRYFNVYGPRQPEVGAYALVMGIFLNQRARGQTLTIHGDGSQRRDFIHVADVVDANIAAFFSPVRGETLNVGSGSNISVRELADLISKDQAFQPRRLGDAEITLADISKSVEHLNWAPKVGFEEGLKNLVEQWHAPSR